MAKTQEKGLRQQVFAAMDELAERRQVHWLKSHDTGEVYKDLINNHPELSVFPFESTISCIHMWRIQKYG